MSSNTLSSPRAFSRTARLRGFASMVVASIMFSLMNVCVYAIGQREPQLPSAIVSFVRIAINFFILLVPALFAKDILRLFGDFRLSLWLRGFFGTLALMLSFASIQMIGPGESAFIAASSGVFVALLGPVVLKQKNSALVWVAILGSFAGLGLLFEPRFADGHYLGRAMALGTGILAALAYLMVAKAGSSNTTQTVVFYFCLVGVALHLAYFGYAGFQMPRSADVWMLLLAGGVSASVAQFYMTFSYQTAPASLVSSIAYLSPVLSLGWGVLLFSRVPDARGLAGCALVLLFGVMLPFLSTVGKR